MDYNLIKNTGIGAAYTSAVIINKYLGNLTSVDKKGPIDLVTEADIASEKNIIKTIRSRFPDHEIFAEESGLNKTADSTCQWIIDPLDGTTNFAHQIPVFAVSIAFAVNNEIKVGIVLNPVSGELFTAVRGQGSTLNGKSIRVSEEKNISDSLLATGFPYDVKQLIDPVMRRFKHCIIVSRGIRRLGSAALDLCFVACGRVEGFWEENLKPWDTAAGWLIAEEAGALVTDFSGVPFSLNKKEILATNRHIHDKMKFTLEI
ncbi:MAG: inositol monophosphatase [Desulfobacteraceae bacterium]|nr:inositol monophosphatase [Desulfobacteraceae bacterium]